MMKQTKYLMFLLAVLLVKISFAQDPNFSQFYNNSLYYNPGMTAIGNGLAMRMNYRNQWAPVAGKFNTFSFSLDAEAVGKTGLGFLASSDIAGEGKLRTQQIAGMYSYRPLETKRLIVQLGFGGAFVYKRVDWSQFVFSDNLDEVFGNVNSSAFVIPNTNTVMYPDFNAGATVRFNVGRFEAKDRKMTTTLGTSFHHLTQPRDAFIGDGERLPMKWLIHGQTNVLLNGLVYSPAFIYEKQNEFSTFTVGMNMMKNPVFAGMWFRNRNAGMNFKSYDSFIFNLGINTLFNKSTRMRLTYSYDFTISRLKTASMGTHEISAVFEFDKVVVFKSIADKRSKKFKTQFKECVDF